MSAEDQISREAKRQRPEPFDLASEPSESQRSDDLASEPSESQHSDDLAKDNSHFEREAETYQISSPLDDL